MEAVRAFNNELSSLYESKPPVSRAKMAQVTKSAIKAIKFYKHVVQSVEKFIQKCKPEYKVPGLYVIDSIVRQSRHQFGPDKDVFSPRFTKNIVTTFTNLFKCPVDERSRVVRVLNLWQKNNVFPMEVIQPLLDLAADPENPDLVIAAQRAVDDVVSSTQKVPLPGTQASSNGDDSSQILQQTEMLATITKLLQQAQEVSLTGIAPESQLQQLQHLQQQLMMQTERISKPHQQPAAPIDSNLLAKIQVLTNQLLSKASGGEDDMIDDRGRMNSSEPLFNKELLDFDYGDSDEDEDRQEHHHHHHHPHHFQRPPPLMHQGMPPMMQDQNHLQQLQIQQMSQQQEQLQSEIGAQEQLRRRVLEQQQQQFDREIGQASMIGLQPPHGFNANMDRGPNDNQDELEIQEGMDRTDFRRQRGSRERSRSPRRRSRRSRSRSRDRRRRSRSRDRQRRSRSKERDRRDKEKEREKERERERERKKRGLPPLRENHISICSMTLWLGHVTKHTSEQELREHIEKYGTIRTINMIPPRGCAFVCLTKRKDAFKALDRLRGIKINGNSLKVAWAPGIGVKESVFKDLWDVELGVTYIPWEQLPAEVTPLVAGGMVDEDSLPERLKGMNTGEEDIEEPPPAENPSTDNADTSHDEDMMTPYQPQQMSFGPPGQPNFTLPGGPLGALGQGLLNLLAASGPLGLLGAPPPMGLQAALGGGGLALGGSGMRLPNNSGMNNMGGLGNMGGLPGLSGPGPHLPGMRPGQINMGFQGTMMGQGNRMASPMGGPSPGMDIRPRPAGMNSPGPRGPFGQFDLPRFQHLQNQGGMRPPFFNSNRADNDQPSMEDGEKRAMAEPKEWPPDDEVNAEDEQDEDPPIDSDERMFPTRGSHSLGRPNLPGMRPFGNLLSPQGMLPGQGHPNAMMGMPRAQSPNPGMPSLRPLRMMPPGQQLPAHPMQGGPGHNFSLAQGGMRLPLPGLRIRPGGLIPAPSSPHVLPPSSGASVPVSANGPKIVTSPEPPVSDMPPINDRDRNSPDLPLPGPDLLRHPDDDLLRLHPPGFMSLRPMQGGNRPPFPPFHGQGFPPMNFRLRVGDGLLGARPDGQGGGFDRFRGPHPLRPFGRMDGPPFDRRFDLPFRPPMGFLDFDEMDGRAECRPFPRFDLDNHSRLHDLDDRSLPRYIDERRRSHEMRGGHPDLEMRGHHPDLEMRGGHPDLKMRGRHPDLEMRGRHPDLEMRGRHLDIEMRGHHPDLEMRGRHPDLEMRGRHPDLEMRGHHPDLEMRGGNSDMEMRGGNSDMEMRGGNSDMEMRGGNSGMEMRGGNSGMEMRGGNSDTEKRGGHSDTEKRGGHPGLEMRSGHPGLEMRSEPQDLEMRGGPPDPDSLEDNAQRSRRRDGSGRVSRWHEETSQPEPAADSSPTENKAVPTESPPPAEEKEASAPLESNPAASSVETEAVAGKDTEAAIPNPEVDTSVETEDKIVNKGENLTEVNSPTTETTSS